MAGIFTCHIKIEKKTLIRGHSGAYHMGQYDIFQENIFEVENLDS